MSHNPYDVALYDLLDATGQMCWDENRDYGAKYGSGVYAVAMRDMVKRDRNHASVIMWSFCNEAECTQYDSTFSGEAFRAAAKGVDPTRPVTANGALSQTPTAQLDIQGGSHWGAVGHLIFLLLLDRRQGDIHLCPLAIVHSIAAGMYAHVRMCTACS